MKPDQEITASETAITPPESRDSSLTAIGKPDAGLPNPADHDDGTHGETSEKGLINEKLSKIRVAAVVLKPSPTPPPSLADFPPSPPISGYRLIRELGSGTYGVVWLAEDERISSVKVAIKFLHSKIGIEALEEEVKRLGMLRLESGIIQVLDFERDADPPYFVMTYAEGESLAQKLKAGPMPLKKAEEMFQRIVNAMAYVHARGIRHCDLKPGNILLDALDRPLIADFGQAHLASDMEPKLGTFFYMAPEQADLEGRVPGMRWDVYGLGALFYSMITSKAPHEDSTLREELKSTEKLSHRLKKYRDAIEHAKPLTAHREVEGMDSQLAEIIERCLAVDPTKRYPTAEGIVEALKQRKRWRRERPILIAGLVAPLLLLFFLGLFGFMEGRSAVKTARNDLVQQAKENYEVSARLAAIKVKEDVERFLGILTEQAMQPELVAALEEAEPGTINKSVQARLAAFYKRVESAEKVGRCCMFDKDGYLIGMFPLNGNENLVTSKQKFNWRGYFHGGIDQPGTGGDFHLVRKSYISQPYVGRSRFEPHCIALSFPISKDPKNNDEPIGLLTIHVDLAKLNDWLKTVSIRGGFAAIVDNRLCLLSHDDECCDKWRPADGKLPTFEHCDFYCDLFRRANIGNGADVFKDPVTDEKFVAGYSRIEFNNQPANHKLEQKWALLVQAKEVDVIRPALNLRNEMLRWGAIIMTIALVLVVIMWLGLAWHVRKQDRTVRI